MGKSASRIVTMLPSTPQVEAVYLDPTNGILAGLRELPGDTPQLHSTHTTNPSAPSLTTESLSSTTTLSQSAASPGTTPSAPHTLLIDQTTLDPTTAARVAQTVQSETSGQALMLDAPVSGGRPIIGLTVYYLTMLRYRRSSSGSFDHYVRIPIFACNTTSSTTSRTDGTGRRSD